MIRVESIRIEEFRGIRDLTLDLNGRSYAVCGPTEPVKPNETVVAGI